MIFMIYIYIIFRISLFPEFLMLSISSTSKTKIQIFSLFATII